MEPMMMLQVQLLNLAEYSKMNNNERSIIFCFWQKKVMVLNIFETSKSRTSCGDVQPRNDRNGIEMGKNSAYITGYEIEYGSSSAKT
jgi:hypothetical protein